MGPCGRGYAGASGNADPDSNEVTTNARNHPPSSNLLPACTRAGCRWYTSHYCEENTLRLCGDLLGSADAAGVQLYVVFISNHARQVPVWCQRLADGRDEPVLWDYHVLLLARHPNGNYIYDLDSTLPFPSEAVMYTARAFRKGETMDDRFRQLFRVVPARECMDHFASDRSHMLERGGVYSAQPPPYPPLRGPLASSAHNMDEWISMNPSQGRGHVLNLAEMERLAAVGPHRFS